MRFFMEGNLVKPIHGMDIEKLSRELKGLNQKNSTYLYDSHDMRITLAILEHANPEFKYAEYMENHGNPISMGYLNDALQSYDLSQDDREEQGYDNALFPLNKIESNKIVFLFIRVSKISTTFLNEVTTKYTEIPAVSLLLQRNVNHKVRCLKIAENKFLIIGNTLEHTERYKLFGLIPAICATNPTVPDTLFFHNFFQAIGNLDDIDWHTLLQKYLTESNILKLKALEELKGTFNAIGQKNKDKLKRNISDFERQIAEWENKVREYFIIKLETENKLWALENKKDTTTTDEVLDFISRNKAIVSCTQNPDRGTGNLKLVIQTGLTDYDMQLIKTILSNKRSDYSPMQIDILREIFVFCKYQIQTTACFGVDLITNRLDILSIPNLHCNAGPHPHISTYNCLGANKTLIEKALVMQDYIGALAQIIGACSNLNAADGTVWRTFKSNLFGEESARRVPLHTTNMLKDAEGNLTSIQQLAITWKGNNKDA